jgi:hypothetical protein
VPAGENPPDGAMIDYFIGTKVSGPVTLEIRDAAGSVVRRYSSADPVPPEDPMLAIPPYWVRPPQALSALPGVHRFLWDVHYEPVPGARPEYPISAVYRNTAPDPTSPWASPGEYTVVLTAGGKSYTQPLTLKMDPRVKASTADLARQFDLSKQLYDARLRLEPVNRRINSLTVELATSRTRAEGKAALVAQIDALNQKLQELVGAANRRPGAPLNIAVIGRAQTLFGVLQDVDAAPTPQVSQAVADVLREAASLLERWRTVESQDIPALNRQLQDAGLPKVGM